MSRERDAVEQLAHALAHRLLAGTWKREELARRTEAMLGPATREDQQSLIERLIMAQPTPYPPSPAWLVAFLMEPLDYPELMEPSDYPKLSDFERACQRVIQRPELVHPVPEPPKFAPLPKLAGLAVPHLATPGDLGRWLGISCEQLDWLADQRRQHGRTRIPILQNYSYAFVPKRRGPPRLIEQPKPRLKTIQRRILHGILDAVPVHDAAHGFVKDRSCSAAAAQHAAEAAVITCDIESFFTATRTARVHAMFRSIGYPWAVAGLLTGLVTTTTPSSVLARCPGRQRYDRPTLERHGAPHLPQGAPTSPALANLCAWRLDCRLSGLARRFEARYTRYADDMTFSGDAAFARRAGSLLSAVDDIVADEGFALNRAKTRVMRRHCSQRVTGIVVNEHLNVPRATFDALKATLHNAVRNGWQHENRDGIGDFRAHLDGRVAWVESLNPRRGARLRRLFDRIAW